MSRILHQGENLLVTLALALMVSLPLAEIVLRKLFHTSISGVTAMVQHLVLVAAMLGGAIAAREDRLLAMSTLKTFLKGRWKTAASIGGSSFAIAMSIGLVVAGFLYVGTSREAGKILAYEIPVWVVQLVMPLGFTAIAWRLFRHSADAWKGRFLTLCLSGLWVAIGLYPPIATEALTRIFRKKSIVDMLNC